MKRLIILLPLLLFALSARLQAFIEFPVADAHIVQYDSVGIQVAAASGNRLFLMHTTEDRTLAAPAFHDTTITAIGWAPGDTMVATGDAQGRVVVLDARTAKQIRSFGSTYSRVGAVAFSPDVTRIAIGYDDGSVHIQSLLTGKELKILQQPVGAITSLLWKGEIILAGGTTGYCLTSQLQSSSVVQPVGAAVTASACTGYPVGTGSSWIVGLADGTAKIFSWGQIGTVHDTATLNTGIREPILSIKPLTYGQVIGMATKSSITYWQKQSRKLQRFYDLRQSFQWVDIAPRDYQYPAVSDGYKVILYDLSSVVEIPEPVAALPHPVAFPNPATDGISIDISLPQPQSVHLALLDYMGRECAVVYSGRQHAIKSTYYADTRMLPAGLYYFVLATEAGKQVVPVTIVR